VRLPRIEAAAREVPTAQAVLHPRKWRILIVDDEDDARESIRALLEMEGHQVTVAANGIDGLAAIAAWKPDAALIDIGLPGIEGYEIARRTRQSPHGQAAILVAITGYGRPEDRAKARSAGFDAHLTKPFSYAELRGALERGSGGIAA
jgi:CheY-like chemotaxis protein